MSGTLHDVIILGSGPAGYTAAIYAARANLNPLLFTGLQPGGQLTITTEVENYPGFPDGIQGPELMEHFRKQAERFGTVVHDIDGGEGRLLQAPVPRRGPTAPSTSRASVIVATGASAMLLGLPSEQQVHGLRRQRLRHLRRLLLQGQTRSWSWAAATPRWRRPTSSRGSARRSWWCTGATSCAHPRSCRSARSPTRRSSFVWNREVAEVLGDRQEA